MRVLVACEFSGTVRDAFRALGHDAVSCDLLPTERPGPHHQGDVRDLLNDGWDLMVAHPPCTFLTCAGAKHLYRDGRKENGRNEARWTSLRQAAEFVRLLLDAPIPRIAVENPIMLAVAQDIVGRAPTQTIQPWQFGHPETKRTCLWLKELPPLTPTRCVQREMLALPKKLRSRVHYIGPGPNRWKQRSLTYAGIALAMAQQWGSAPAQADLFAEAA